MEETESTRIVARGQGEGGVGHDCLMGTGFPTGVLKNVLEIVAMIMKVLNATELYTSKWLKW